MAVTEGSPAPTGIGELDEMVAALERAPEVYRPSRFWQGIVARHADILKRDGLETFKQTLNTSYFGLNSRYYWRALPRLVASFLRHPSPAPLGARAIPCDRLAARPDALLALAVGLLYWHVRAEDPIGMLDRLHEPPLGCPTRFRIGGRETTQDLCHSVSELTFLRPHLPERARIAELGAGYGRLAYVALSMLEGVRYHVVDIPPTLYVSQTYLTATLPDVPTFRFREFASYGDVAEELGRAQLVFLEPQQLALLPEDSFDAVVTISSLDEMTLPQIETYLHAIDRVCRGVMYSKQWDRGENRLDGFVIREDEYPIPARWRTIRRRQALVPPRMFERIYACRAPATGA